MQIFRRSSAYAFLNRRSKLPLRHLTPTLLAPPLLALLLVMVLVGCQPFAASAQNNLEARPISFEGQGAGEIPLDAWQGPAVLHLTASDGSQPFSISAVSGLDFYDLVQAESSIDEYRGIRVDPDSKMQLRVTGDRKWKVEVLPVRSKSFDTLQTPGTFTGQGNRVFLVQGKHGVVTFDTGGASRFEAWAIGESQIWEHLKITADGDYKGKSVLPRQTYAIIVSTSGPWSVLIPEPCCEKLW